MSANERQEGGDHYQVMDPQPWDVTLAWSDQGHIGHGEAVIIEYVARHRRKNGVQDLIKAKHWLEKLIEREQSKPHPGVYPLWKQMDWIDDALHRPLPVIKTTIPSSGPTNMAEAAAIQNQWRDNLARREGSDS